MATYDPHRTTDQIRQGDGNPENRHVLVISGIAVVILLALVWWWFAAYGGGKPA